MNFGLYTYGEPSLTPTCPIGSVLGIIGQLFKTRLFRRCSIIPVCRETPNHCRPCDEICRPKRCFQLPPYPTMSVTCDSRQCQATSRETGGGTRCTTTPATVRWKSIFVHGADDVMNQSPILPVSLIFSFLKWEGFPFLRWLFTSVFVCFLFSCSCIERMALRARCVGVTPPPSLSLHLPSAFLLRRRLRLRPA